MTESQGTGNPNGKRKEKGSDAVVWQTPLTTNSASQSYIPMLKPFQYITITGQLRMVSWSDSSHPTGVVKLIFKGQTFPLPTMEGQSFENS